jgi:tetratricopeptide (TPR) repeat protein
MNKKMSSLKIQKLLKQSSIYCQTGNFEAAKEIYLELLKTIPNHPQVLTNLGTIELQTGDLKQGILYLSKSLQTNPMQPIAIANLANGFLDLGKFDEAIKHYQSALKLDPNSSEIFYNLGRAFKAIREFDNAIYNYQKAIKIDPKRFLAFFNLGSLYNEIGEYALAIKQFDEAININPFNALFFYNRGIAYENSKQYDFAIRNYDEAIKIDQNFESAYANKSGVLSRLTLYEEALKNINIAIKINPENPINYNKKAFILEEMKDFDAAIENYDQAIKVDPNFSIAIKNKATCQLALNLFKEGWPLYEARWLNTLKESRLISSKPELFNFEITNKTIYIWAEQGIGDQILFGSLFVDALKNQNKFIISLDKRLIDLFSRSFQWATNVTFIKSSDVPNENLYDFHIPLGNLGKFFRNSSFDFKNQMSPFLLSNKSYSKILREKISSGSKKICGISWKSKNSEFGLIKSVSLEQLLPILSIPNLSFVNLQYGETSDEIKNIFNAYGIKIQSLDEIDNFNDIDSLASLIDACDLIVSVSNVTAHIAGALNIKTYLLLPFSFGKIWYWGENSSSSLWYPSVHISRQDKSNSWNKAIKDLSNKLIYD